ncbi:MAG: hypothetical protein ABSG68_25625, partial [Thermoguttaceae bacterium]
EPGIGAPSAPPASSVQAPAPARGPMLAPVPQADNLSNEALTEDPVFGNSAPPRGCENCAQCVDEPSPWYLENEVRAIYRGKAGEYATTFPLFNVVKASTASVSVSGGTATTPALFFGNQLGLNPNPTTNPTFSPIDILNTHSIDFNIGPGYSFTLGRYLGQDAQNRDHYLEFSYWGLQSWEASKEVTGGLLGIVNESDPYDPGSLGFPTFSPFLDMYTGNLASNFRLVTLANIERALQNPQFGAPSPQDFSLSRAFNQVEAHTVEYHTHLENIEANLRADYRPSSDRLVLQSDTGRWRRECDPGLTWGYLFGLRAMFIQERFQFLSHGTYYEAVPVPSTTGLPMGDVPGGPIDQTWGRYVIRTDNNLLGMQTGLNFTYHYCKWEFDLHSKFGPYINLAQQNSRLQANPGQQITDNTGVLLDPIVDVTNHGEANRLAYVGEFGFGTTYKLRADVVLRGSYDMMWVGNLALAPEQLVYSATPPSMITTTGVAFYSGLSMGLEYTW